jgi:dihydropyrimidinase
VLWDPQATKTLSVKTQHSLGDFNIFEGMTVRGQPTHTLSRGKLVYANGQLNVERGAGQYVKRPAFGPQFDALARKAALAAPVAVKR